MKDAVDLFGVDASGDLVGMVVVTTDAIRGGVTALERGSSRDVPDAIDGSAARDRGHPGERCTEALLVASGVSLKYLYSLVGQRGVPNKTAERLLLCPGDQAELERLTRSSTVPAAAAQRARIVLLAAEGVANYVIAERVGVTRPTVNLWRTRYAAGGMAGLVGQKRPGRPR